MHLCDVAHPFIMKPQPDLLNHPGVIYRIPCLDCDCSYIGETGRTLRVRLSEHQRCCRNFELRSQQLHNTTWRNTIEELTGKAALS